MNDDERHLLASIRAEPENDDLRLIYADWLEDHGRPALAEFIRTQLALAQHPEDQTKRPQWLRRQQQLLKDYKTRWLHDVPGPILDRYFRRGLLAYLYMRAERFAKYFPVLAPHHAITSAHVVDCESWFDALLEIDDWHGLKCLALVNSQRSIPGIAQHGRQSPANGVDRLWLEPGLPWESTLGKLSQSSLSGQLSTLIPGMSFSSVDLATLADQPFCRQLTHLDLSETTLDDHAGQILAQESAFSSLETLVLAGSDLGAPGLAPLAESKTLTKLTQLQISPRFVDDEVDLGSYYGEAFESDVLRQLFHPRFREVVELLTKRFGPDVVRVNVR